MIEFKQCPDCGYDGYPTFNREDYVFNSDGVVMCGKVSASCHKCGWQTDFCENVKECAKKWNDKKFD